MGAARHAYAACALSRPRLLTLHFPSAPPPCRNCPQRLAVEGAEDDARTREALRTCREQLREQPERFHVEVTFVAEGFEAPKPPCTCVLRDRTVGFCEICGGHGNRVVVNPEEED